VVGTRFGVGIDRGIVVASLRALVCAPSRLGLAGALAERVAARRAA